MKVLSTLQNHFSVQFHPEGNGGPDDTEFLFQSFMDLIETESLRLIQLNV